MNRFRQWLHGLSLGAQCAVINLAMMLYTLVWGGLLFWSGRNMRLEAPHEWILLAIAIIVFPTAGRFLLDKLTYWAVHEDRPERHNDRREDSADH